MGTQTNIAWTESTINTVWGCKRVDINPETGACVNCYMFRIAPTFGKDPNVPWRRKLDRVQKDCEKMIREGKDRAFFNSMSDTFWEAFPDEEIETWHTSIIERYPEIQFQILTKRIGRAFTFYKKRGKIPANAWIGCSIGARDRLFRLAYLRRIKTLFPKNIVWISFEPLLQDLGENYSLQGIDWCVVGGESDKKHPRLMNPSWAEHIRWVAARDGCAFFFKQVGGIGGSGAGGDLLNGVRYLNYPTQYLERLNKMKMDPGKSKV